MGRHAAVLCRFQEKGGLFIGKMCFQEKGGLFIAVGRQVVASNVPRIENAARTRGSSDTEKQTLADGVFRKRAAYHPSGCAHPAHTHGRGRLVCSG